MDNSQDKYKPRLIGLCGKKRSGKDTITNYLCDNYQYNNKKIATDLKILIKLLFGLSDSQLETDEKDIIDKNWNITPRKIMQFFGTEIMQIEIQRLLPNINKNFWIKSFIKKNLKDKENYIVISDLRFIHEYKELEKENIFVIRVERNKNMNIDEHISEKEYLDIPADIVIQNNGTIEELYKNIEFIMTKLY